MTVGEPVNPCRTVCGFYPPDVYGASREDGDGPKRLYERLVRWAGTKGYCWPSVETMAAALGKSERQIRADMAVLVSRRLIQVTRRGNAEGGRSTNEYRFLFHEMFEGSYRQDIAGEGEEGNRQDTAAKVGELPAGYGEVTGRIALGNRQDIAGSYKEDELRNELRNELHNTRSPKVSKREADSLVEKWFAEFWETYPRKVGKAAALRIAGKVAKFPKDREAIMAGLTRQLPELQSREPQYIPHAATWLNQRRWEDEPESPTQALTVRGPYEDKWAARDRGRNEMFRDLIGSRLKNGEIQ